MAYTSTLDLDIRGWIWRGRDFAFRVRLFIEYLFVRFASLPLSCFSPTYYLLLLLLVCVLQEIHRVVCVPDLSLKLQAPGLKYFVLAELGSVTQSSSCPSTNMWRPPTPYMRGRSSLFAPCGGSVYWHFSSLILVYPANLLTHWNE